MSRYPILKTKLYVPPVRPELVSRPRLMERLNTGLDRKLTLISAPAGFGKTTLVSEWLAGLRLPAATQGRIAAGIAWLSLDEGDNDPARFLAYLIAALQTIEATLGQEGLDVLDASQRPPAEELLTALINEIAAIPERTVLVLDDYHLIDAKPIHDALGFLLEHLPPRMHLLITTRDDPHLPLARLRARGQLIEVRAADLRFSSSEASEFLNRVMDLDLSVQDIAALETRTEGWIAGLQLAAISMQGRADPAAFIQAFTGSHRFIVDYLVQEVLQVQSERVRSFLLQTSILDRLCGPLCDAVRFGSAKAPPGQDGRGMLEALERGNLFVVPLDDERQWVRYHHLFADVLQAHLMEEQPDLVPRLHRRASEWYEGNGSLPDAIRHALAAEDFERAANLAELAWPGWSGTSQLIVWLSWVDALPEALFYARPVLSVAYAQALLNAGKLEAAHARLLDVERWLEPPSEVAGRLDDPPAEMVVADPDQFRSLPASLATARAYHAQATGDVPATVKYTERALGLLAEGDHHRRASLTTLLGLTYWAHGDLEAAHRTVSEGLGALQRAGNIPAAIGGTFVLADINMALGRLHEAKREIEWSLKLARGMGGPMPPGTEDLCTALSKLHRERGDLKAAAQALAKGKKLGEQVEVPDWQYRWCIARAGLEESLGDLDKALDLLDEAERLYVRTPLPDVRPIAASRARIWARQGRLAEALAWVRERGLSANDDPCYLREFEHVTLARVLIAQTKSGREDSSIHEVMGLLERLLRAAEEGKWTGSAIEILVLQALAHEAQGEISPALVSLERALTLAEPEGYFRIFVDQGPSMARLLYEALSQGLVPKYVQRLLAAFPASEPEPAPDSAPGSDESEWVEALSKRELEVLQLIAAGLTNQEIAGRLYLSLNTVKVHARNIYGKLDVHHRAGAVARARALGILLSD